MSNNNQSIKESDLVKSLEKGLVVIQAFSESTKELTISQAAQITGLSKPATRRILLTLNYLGYLYHDKDGKFTLTPKILSLGYGYFATNQLWPSLTPYLEKLCEKVDESASISVLEGNNIIYVTRFSKKRIMSMDLNVGASLPAFATAMGQILIANLSDEKREEVIKSISFEKFTEYSIKNKEQFKQRLNLVKDQGYILVKEELELGLNSLSAPIKNGEGRVVAAINISMHTSKLTNENILNDLLIPALLESANEISELVKSMI